MSNLPGKVAYALEWRARAAATWGRRTAEIVRETGRAFPAQALPLARRLAVVRRHGFTLDEAFTLGLLDPSLAPSDMRGQVSKRRLIRAQDRLNPRELLSLTEDKAVFYRYAEAIALPIPELHAILCSSGSGWARTGQVLARPADWARFLESGAPEEFVVKPSRGFHGHGVHIIRRRGASLDIAGAGTTTAAALCEELAADRQFHSWVVQERLRDHPDLPGDGEALQTLRIVTFVEQDGRVRVINAQFRIATGGDVVDNFRDGTTGNLLSIVDLADGSLGGIVTTDGRRVFEIVPPGTLPGAPPEGARLPLWREICDAVTAAAPHFLPLRSIGWDVAVTPNGPRIVEANIWWDPPTPQPDLDVLTDWMTTA